MEEKGIKAELIRRVRKIYEDTEVTIRSKEGLTRRFRVKSVRQSCVMNPVLFNLHIADIDKEMEKRGIGNITIGNERIWTLAYADDSGSVSKKIKLL